MPPPGPLLDVALVGCGAVAEHYYAPALAALAKPENLRIAVLVDPDPARLVCLGRLFPEAARCNDLDGLPAGSTPPLAIIASPPRFHARQAITLLERDAHVLCEKPLAIDLEEAGRMVDAARAAGRLLTAGYFRRFFPTSEFVHDLLRARPLGEPRTFIWSEGGPFEWPAASPSFFQRNSSAGGVLADAGSHIIDLLIHWFGPPVSFDYEDDAMGGLEANAQLALRFADGVSGSIRLSREAPIANHFTLRFERGSVAFAGASARQVTLGLDGCAASVQGGLQSAHALPAFSYQQAFMAQVVDLARAVRDGSAPRVPAAETLAGMDLITRCYRSRRLMDQPWLPDKEYAAAQRFSIAPLTP